MSLSVCKAHGILKVEEVLTAQNIPLVLCVGWGMLQLPTLYDSKTLKFVCCHNPYAWVVILCS